jgi:dimethylglycine dehydrogenase
MDEFELYASTAETVGIPHEWLSAREIGARWPLVRTGDLVGALFHLTDGYINPADVTQAMAKGARQRGAEIVRKAQVDGYEWAGSEWIVRGSRMVERGGNLVPGEERFEIRAEHVVTATGNHAQRTARLLGLKIPAIPVEHQYIVTEPDPALVAFVATPSTRCCATPTPSGTCARSAAAGSSGPTSAARRRASSTACPTASAPTCSRSTSSVSSRSTCR